MHRAGFGGVEQRASVPSVGAPPCQHLCLHPIVWLSEPHRLGVLWRLHYQARLMKSLAFGNGALSLASLFPGVYWGRESGGKFL